MPPVIPFIPLIIGGITAAMEVKSLVGGGGAPKAPDPSKLTPLTATQNDQQKALVGQQLPNLQALTGGSLSPEYAAQFGATQSGLSNDPQASGNIQAAINQFFGLTAPGTTGFSSGGTTGGGIMDLIKKPPASSSGGNFANDMLSSDMFKGLVG